MGGKEDVKTVFYILMREVKIRMFTHVPGNSIIFITKKDEVNSGYYRVFWEMA